MRELNRILGSFNVATSVQAENNQNVTIFNGNLYIRFGTFLVLGQLTSGIVAWLKSGTDYKLQTDA